MLEHLKRVNPNVPFYSVEDQAFAPYGRIVESVDMTELISTAKNIEMPKDGSAYLPSVEAFEALTVAAKIRDVFYGELSTQVGYCYGHSNFLNGLEWHACNEINVAVTPMVLILGLVTELENGKTDVSKLKAFYVPEGTVL